MRRRRIHSTPELARSRGLTSTELAVLMPVLILLTLLPVQVGLWWHAKQAAEVAAEEAVDAAQLARATSIDGERGAQAILGQAGNLRYVTITVNRGIENGADAYTPDDNDASPYTDNHAAGDAYYK